MITPRAHESFSASFLIHRDELNEYSVQTGEQEKVDLTTQHALVSLASQGDQDAFGAIVDQYNTLLLRTALMIVGDLDSAEDVVQDSFIQVWHHLPELRNAGALRPWLIRIVVNQCLSCKRRNNRSHSFMLQARSEQAIDLMAQVAADQQGYLERTWDLAQAIVHLPPKQRTVIVLHYYHGMTLSEMAQALTTSENTLKKRIQSALTRLRHLLHIDETHDPLIGQHIEKRKPLTCRPQNSWELNHHTIESFPPLWHNMI